MEVAASVPNNGTANGTNNSGGYSVGPTYTGILQSQVLNLDPPVLLRFSNTEIVHVQPVGSGDPVNGVPTKTGINPGQQVTLTVRLSDREAGIDNGGDSAQFPTGAHTNAAKPQVFLQIKDPDSKYQDAQKLEHKLFASDDFYNTQANHFANDVTSGSNNDFLPLDGKFVGGLRDDYPTYGFLGQYVSQGVSPRRPTRRPRAVPTAASTPRTAMTRRRRTIFIGKSGGGTNPTQTTAITGTVAGQTFVPGTDPELVQRLGAGVRVPVRQSRLRHVGRPERARRCLRHRLRQPVLPGRH